MDPWTEGLGGWSDRRKYIPIRKMNILRHGIGINEAAENVKKRVSVNPW